MTSNIQRDPSMPFPRLFPGFSLSLGHWPKCLIWPKKTIVCISSLTPLLFLWVPAPFLPRDLCVCCASAWSTLTLWSPSNGTSGLGVCGGLCRDPSNTRVLIPRIWECYLGGQRDSVDVMNICNPPGLSLLYTVHDMLLPSLTLVV